ncbi:MAG: serine/threonine-protein kinase [Burkholderiaceae bacterium]|jgi:serine/threonine protein kinase
MASQTNAPLPDGYELEGYRIVKKISSGGFSIVYLARDEFERPVAIKEYLPSSLALRRDGELSPTISEENLPTFRIGLKCFFEEGRALARILHPNVVRVVNFFRANETVYMVMQYEQGRSLQEHILRHRERGEKKLLGERFIRMVFSQVMNGLREVHTNKLLHLDLKPANIYLRSDGSPILLDFGAARQTLQADTGKLYPMYTPGFAAPELYEKNGSMGPWTDIYSIGASIFAGMSGHAPQPADARLLNDKMSAKYRDMADSYSEELLGVVEWCLRLDPLARPQSVFALQKALLERAATKPKPPQNGKVRRVLQSLLQKALRPKEQNSTISMNTHW